MQQRTLNFSLFFRSVVGKTVFYRLLLTRAEVEV